MIPTVNYGVNRCDNNRVWPKEASKCQQKLRVSSWGRGGGVKQRDCSKSIMIG